MVISLLMDARFVLLYSQKSMAGTVGLHDIYTVFTDGHPICIVVDSILWPLWRIYTSLHNIPWMKASFGLYLTLYSMAGGQLICISFTQNSKDGCLICIAYDNVFYGCGGLCARTSHNMSMNSCLIRLGILPCILWPRRLTYARILPSIL